MTYLARIVAGLFALVLASSASAMLVYDVKEPGVKLKEGDSHTISHDLTDEGVPDDYLVTEAWLKLSFSDGLIAGDLSKDLAGVSGDGLSGTFEVDGTHLFGYDIRVLNVGGSGIDSLNSAGLLEVTVTALDTKWYEGFNDFWWKVSKLKAKVEPVPVPEPATAALLALGLGGLVASRRRQRC